MGQKILQGTKLFKWTEDDEFDILRVKKIYNPDKFRLIMETAGGEITTSPKALKDEGYSILEPIGLLTFNVVNIGKNKDVIVTYARYLDLKMGMNAPCVICRQSVTDFFYNLLANTEEHGYVGVSVSDKTCPTNIEYGELLACDDIEFSEVVNTYYDDTIDSIMKVIRTIKYDDVLSELYTKHVKASNNPMLRLKSEDHGWCKHIKDLLTLNNFWIDVDAAHNITDVDFPIEDHLNRKIDLDGYEEDHLDVEAVEFLKSTFKINIVDTLVTRYYYDIDLGEYRNSNYVLIRDSKNILWVVVYLVEGVYLEQDLATIEAQESISHKLGLKIYNKYTEQSEVK